MESLPFLVQQPLLPETEDYQTTLTQVTVHLGVPHFENCIKNTLIRAECRVVWSLCNLCSLTALCR